MKNISTIYSGICLAYLFLFTGCANLSPEYTKPDQVGENKKFILNDNNISYNSVAWWKEYKNKNLDSLVELMLTENQDIVLARKQISYNEENLNTIHSYGLPSLNLKDEIIIDENKKTNKFGLNINSFEIDYLGKINQTLIASNSDLKIANFNMDYLKMTSSYDLVSSYYSIVSLNEEINITKNIIKNYKEQVSIIKDKVSIGLESSISLINIEMELNNSQRDLQLLIISKNNMEKQLKFLLGKDIDIKYESIPLIDLNEKIIASKNIDQRFDIQIAENELIKENAKIGIVKAQYFPTLSLSAFLGVNSSNEILNSSTNYWSISPSIVFNIFDYGNTKSLVEKQKISKEIALTKYVKTVRNAFMDVKSNYLNYIQMKESFLYSKNVLEGLNTKFNIVSSNYEIGLISRRDFLLMENELQRSKISFEKAKTDYFVSQLNLRKSLNGMIQ
jgi:multidrug efflux system outer membrane protein